MLARKLITRFYGKENVDDIHTTQLQIESEALLAMFHNEKLECFDDIIRHIKKMPRQQLLLIPNIITICKLILFNPATAATAERLLSTARHKNLDAFKWFLLDLFHLLFCMDIKLK